MASVWKIYVFLILTIGSVVSQFALGRPGFNYCIDDSVCICDHDNATVTCPCPTNYSMNVMAFHIMESKYRISFMNCRQIFLSTLSISSFPPKEFEIFNVDQLLLQNSVFHDISSMDSIVLHNVTIDKIPSYAFCNIANLKHIEFRNVTINQILPDAFYNLKDVGSFIMEDCSIDTIHEKAFNNTLNLQNFRIINTEIKYLKPEAMVFRNIGEFVLSNSKIFRWNNQSLTMVNASRVVIDSCLVDELDENAITTMLTNNLFITNNTFALVKNNAFNGITDASNVTFRGNEIQLVESESLAVLFTKGSFMDIKNNSITCDENICWMFQDFEDVTQSWYEDNFCRNSSNNLAKFASMVDDEDICHSDQPSGAGSFQHDQSAPVNNGLPAPIAHNHATIYLTVFLVFFAF